MKQIVIGIISLITLFLAFNLHAQDISFIPHDTLAYGGLGSEIVIEIDVTNLTAIEQTVFIVRTENNLPAGWTSALCFDLCFASFVDSIATTMDFGSTPLAPGETREVSLHFFTDSSIATGYVQLQAGTFHNPNERITVDLTGTTEQGVSVNDENILNSYSLSQNYPNPFNPSTKISYNVGEPGLVELKVYNVLGVEVATLVNEQKNSGSYSVDFNAAKLSSGVYFYSISVNDFTQTRKMILEK